MFTRSDYDFMKTIVHCVNYGHVDHYLKNAIYSRRTQGYIANLSSSAAAPRR